MRARPAAAIHPRRGAPNAASGAAPARREQALRIGLAARSHLRSRWPKAGTPGWPGATARRPFKETLPMTSETNAATNANSQAEVDLSEPKSLQRWASALGVTAKALESAVLAVGPRRPDQGLPDGRDGRRPGRRLSSQRPVVRHCHCRIFSAAGRSAAIDRGIR